MVINVLHARITAGGLGWSLCVEPVTLHWKLALNKGESGCLLPCDELCTRPQPLAFGHVITPDHLNPHLYLGVSVNPPPKQPSSLGAAPSFKKGPIVCVKSFYYFMILSDCVF